MAAYDSGGAAARLSESFQQTDDKETRGEGFLVVSRIFLICRSR